MEKKNPGAALERLVDIMSRLRAEGGCPWDREQDIRTLRPYLVEETFEVLDEMDRVGSGGPWAPLCEELGDLLFQIVFHAQLAAELGEFGMADVCQAISDKIVSRHPHVFANAKAANATVVLENWAKLKAEERKKKTGSEGSVLDGVPRTAPALLRAERLTEKASRIGFDWPDLAGVRAKVQEELGELDEAIAKKDHSAMEHELGDVLFALTNLARFLKTPAEDALRGTIHRFTQRFHHIEHGLRERQVPFGQATLQQMDALWVEAKGKEALVPKPARASRLPISGLERPVSSLEEVEKFWRVAAPLLGWSLEISRDGQALHLHDGAFTLSFVRGDGARVEPGALTLRIPVPDPAVISTLESVPKISVQRNSSDEVCFSDPSGLRFLCCHVG